MLGEMPEISRQASVDHLAEVQVHSPIKARSARTGKRPLSGKRTSHLRITIHLFSLYSMSMPFFSKLVFRPRHDPIPIAPFATTANHLVAPRLYRATIINQHGGADQEEPRIFLIMARAPQEREVPHLIFLTRRIAHSFRQHRVKLALGEFLGLRRYWLARRHHPIHRAVTCSQLRWSSLRHRHQGLLKSLV